MEVGLDGGDVRDWEQMQHHFEVIVNKSVPCDGAPTCFGCAHGYDDKLKRRSFEVLKPQGIQINPQITFPSPSSHRCATANVLVQTVRTL